MSTIYLISGMGADEQVFRYLRLPGVRVRHIHWITPERQDSMESYAKRLSVQVDSDDAILIGLSFGGMLAQEVARLRPIKQIILISSVKSRDELPPYYRFASLLGLHRLIPAWFIKMLANIVGILLPSPTEIGQGRRAAFLRADAPFITWMIKAAARWHPRPCETPIYHIHGTDDIILPARYVTADHLVRGGTHYMIVERAVEVSAILVSGLDEA